jgi:hypothetical protein
MKAEVKQEVTVTLQLSEQEALWLKANVQNPFRDGPEEPGDTEMRRVFWDALKDVQLF